MAGREIPKSIGVTPAAGSFFPFEAIHEINERCVELLVQIARSDSNYSPALPSSLRQRLRETTPEDRKRAAQRPYLLVDFEFRNVDWWEAVCRFPEKPFRESAWRSPFPKRSALPLTRATLIAAREASRADLDTACLLLGAQPRVAEIISRLPTTEIDRIADQRSPHLEVRWADRPAIWHALLVAAANPHVNAFNAIDARGLQLLTGDLLPDGKSSRKQA